MRSCSGWSASSDPGPADRVHRRVASGASDEREEGQELFATELAAGAGLIHELRVEQLGHQVIGRVFRAMVEVLAEPHRGFEHPREAVVLLVGRQVVLRVVEGVPECTMVLLGQPEEHADHLNRQHRREILDEVELSRSDERLGRGFEEFGDVGLDSPDCSWGEEA
jgi:hypothetical protein